MRPIYDFLDLYPYFIIYLIFVISIIDNKAEAKKIKFIFLYLLLFTICRYNVGWDYMSYIDYIKLHAIHGYESRFEPLSRLIIEVSAKVNFWPLTFIVFGIIYIGTMCKVIDIYSKDKILSWAIFALYPGFLLWSFSTLRQCAAIAIVFFSYHFLKNEKKTYFFVTIFIASLFHITAWYGLVLLFLYKVAINNKLNWIFFVLSFFVGNLLLPIMASLDIGNVDFYLNSDETHQTSLLNIFYYAVNSIILLNYKKLVDINKDNEFYIKVSNWAIVSFNIFMFEPITSVRLCSMLLVFWILLIPSFAKIVKSRSLVLFAFIAYNIFYLMNNIVAYNSGELYTPGYVPYDFWWNHMVGE